MKGATHDRVRGFQLILSKTLDTDIKSNIMPTHRDRYPPYFYSLDFKIRSVKTVPIQRRYGQEMTVNSHNLCDIVLVHKQIVGNRASDLSLLKVNIPFKVQRL